MSGTVFDPAPSMILWGGKGFIVSIILPNAATSIVAGTSSRASFYNFSNLKSVSGANITTIGEYAFSGLRTLATLDIPKITDIKDDAFYNPARTDLTITMGPTAPKLGYYIILGSTGGARTVKIKIPAGATGYTPAASPFNGTSVTISGSNVAETWANGVRGPGWAVGGFVGYSYNINQDISLTIEQK